MKIILTLFLLTIHFFAINQITEIESKLRTKPEDTIVGWKKNGNFAFNLAQTSLTNWASGGQNSIAINTLFNYTINYKNKTSSWDNSFDVGYGILRQGEVKTFTKTDDKMDQVQNVGRNL